MKGVIRFSLNNKFAIWILTIIVTVAGLYAGLHMKEETIPNIDVPVLTVATVYPGAAPEEVADSVTKPLEQRIKNLNGVDQVNSTSMENVSSIVVQYKFGMNMDKAQTELRDAIAGYTKPQGAQDTKVSRISLNAFPVVSLSVSGEGQSLEDITKLVESEIQPALESIGGVGQVAISGEQIKEAQIRFDDAKLKELGLSEDTVKGMIQGSAVQAPLGLFQLGGTEKTLVVDGHVSTLDDLKHVEIPLLPSAGKAAGGNASAGSGFAGAPAAGSGGAGTRPSEAGSAGAGAVTGETAAPIGGTASVAPGAGLPTVKLSDIADVQLVARAESISRTNGKESVGINVTKASDANTVDVVNAVKEEGKKIEADHPGVHVDVLLDQGKPIQESVRTMLSKALFGALFAVLVILLFLRNLRTTIISIVSIPLSLLIALLILKQMDITLNIMTLGAMTVAIGRVVDDSIVVIENNYRRLLLRSEPLRGKALVLSATREMFLPILSSTLVTIAVFLPLGTVSGPIGQLFLPFALTIVFALLASLLVAITVVPALAHFMFRKGIKPSSVHDDRPGALARRYRSVLNWVLDHKWIASTIAVVLLFASLGLAPVIGVSFLPDQEDKFAMVSYNPGPGKLLADTEKTTLDAEKLLLARPGVTSLQYSVGGQNPMSQGPNKSALFYVQYKSDTKNFSDVKKQLVEDLKQLDPAGSWKEQNFGGGGGGGIGGSKASLTVYGESIPDIEQAVGQIQDAIKDDPSFDKIGNSLSKTYDQYTLVANQPKLGSLGLTAAQIAMKLSPVRTPTALTTIRQDGKEYPVYVIASQQANYGGIDDMRKATLASPLGVQVPLSEVTTVVEGTSPNTITRRDGKLYAEVSANITIKNVGKASNELKTKVNALQLPAGVKIDFGGVTQQINDTFTQLGLAMAAAVAIVYLLLVITFGGAITPLAILFSLPFTVIGGLVGLWMAGETISASAMMGALMLIGIVVTNAIVLIDRVLHKERDGLGTREALLEAGGTRLRPILMTALATIGALLPLALGYEGGSSGLISKGLGVTVIGGLVSSTVLTLVVVPIVYEALSRFRRKPLQEDHV